MIKQVVEKTLAEVLPPTLFFVVGANLIKALVRLSYAPDTLTTWNTLLFSVAAVIAAKAVILLDLLPWIGRLDERPLIEPILFRASLYFSAICALRFGEMVVHARFKSSAVEAIVRSAEWNRVVALNGWLLLLCLTYAFLNQIDREVEGGLARAMFSREMRRD